MTMKVIAMAAVSFRDCRVREALRPEERGRPRNTYPTSRSCPGQGRHTQDLPGKKTANQATVSQHGAPFILLKQSFGLISKTSAKQTRASKGFDFTHGHEISSFPRNRTRHVTTICLVSCRVVWSPLTVQKKPISTSF